MILVPVTNRVARLSLQVTFSCTVPISSFKTISAVICFCNEQHTCENYILTFYKKEVSLAAIKQDHKNLTGQKT